MATESIDYRLVLNTSGFDTPMANARAKAAGVGDAMAGGAKGAADFDKGLNKLRGAATATAGAVGGLSAAFGVAGTQSQKVLNAAGLLGNALALGGPVGLALAAAAGAVALFAKKQGEAEKAVEKFSKALKEKLKADLDAATKSADDAAIALANFGKTGGQIAVVIEKAKLRQMAGDLAAMRKSFEASGVDINGTMGQYLVGLAEAVHAQKEIVREKEREAVALDGINRREKAREALNQANALAAKHVTDMLDAEADAIIAREKALADAAASRDKAFSDLHAKGLALEKSNGEKRLEFARDVERLKLEAAERRIEEQMRLENEAAARYQQLWTDAAQGAYGAGLSALQGYLADVITGQEHAAERALAAFLVQTGGQLVGLGVKAQFEGATIIASSHGLDPAGYALVGIGTGAVAAGIGMGAAGVAVGHVASGGTVGRALPQAGVGGASSDGVSAGSLPATSGPTQVTNVYQFNGPVFGDHNQSARHVAALQRHAESELFEGRR